MNHNFLIADSSPYCPTCLKWVGWGDKDNICCSPSKSGPCFRALIFVLLLCQLSLKARYFAIVYLSLFMEVFLS